MVSLELSVYSGLPGCPLPWYLGTFPWFCLAEMSVVTSLCMGFCWMHCPTPWGKEIGIVQVTSKASTCPAWICVCHSPLCNTNLRGHPESRASPELSSQPRPMDRGLAIPQQPCEPCGAHCSSGLGCAGDVKVSGGPAQLASCGPTSGALGL